MIRDLQQYPQGIAHFLEHKLFEREDSGDVMAAFTELGAESNAFTSFTNTSYLFSTSENVLECLDLLEELSYYLQYNGRICGARKRYHSAGKRNVSG